MDSCSTKLGNNTFLNHIIKDPLPKIPDALFWDTSLPASAIFHHPKSDRRKATIIFLERLLKEKTIIAFSSILFDEFIHISIRNELKKSLYTASAVNKVLEKNERKFIEPHISDIQKNMTALQEIISKFKPQLRIIYPSEPGIITKALELRLKYNLRHCDSFHLATMLFGSHRHIACFDRKDFLRVDSLNLWCRY